VQAFERMERDLQLPIGEALESGLIYTSGVGLLRGRLQEGAAWLREPPKIDVIWIGIPAFPEKGASKHGLQDWYIDDADRAAMCRILDLAFASAASRGCEALVLPPVGCSSHACSHPALGVASAIREVAQRYKEFLPQVIVSSDHPSHFRGTCWDDFEEVVRTGKPRPDPLVVVPPLPCPPWVLSRKSAKEVKERKAVVAKALLEQEAQTARCDRILSSRRPELACQLLSG